MKNLPLLNLAVKSLKFRKWSSWLTIVSIALSVMLLIGVERTRRAAEDGFTNAISQTDLLVGGRTGPINLILYSVFNMGSPTNNVSWESYQYFANHPAVAWTIPYSLGDSHNGFRVIGTEQSFFKYYRFRGDQRVEFQNGAEFSGLWDVVIGSKVADQLGYELGSKVVIAHGVTKGQAIQSHDDKPFAVVGILKPTGTNIDQSVYISLKAMEAIHMDWTNGMAPTKENAIPQNTIDADQISVQQITSFFIGTKSRIETLRLQREINTYETEPLSAVIPGATLAELWRTLGYFEQVLRAISWMVILVGLVSMLIALLTSLNERRREMAILRSIGANLGQISWLLVFESTLLTTLGILMGLISQSALFLLIGNWLATEFGFYLTGSWLSWYEVKYLVGTLFLGFLTGWIPAKIASQNAIKDGLTKI